MGQHRNHRVYFVHGDEAMMIQRAYRTIAEPSGIELIGAAYHEAGHVVSAVHYGLPVGEIIVRENGDSNSKMGSATHLGTIDRVIICMAGAAAQQHFQTPVMDKAILTDYATILDFTSEMSDEQRELTVEIGFARARQIIAQNAETVARLAKALIACRSINFSEFQPPVRKTTTNVSVRHPGEEKAQGPLALTPANKNPEITDGDACDYDVYHGDERVGRIRRRSRAPHGFPWFWTITQRAWRGIHNRGYAATPEQAIADFKAMWSSEILTGPRLTDVPTPDAPSFIARCDECYGQIWLPIDSARMVRRICPQCARDLVSRGAMIRPL